MSASPDRGTGAAGFLNPIRVLRWSSLGLTAAGIFLGLIALSGSAWLHFSNNGQNYGVNFSLTQKLVRAAGSALPVAARLYFGWVAWVLLVVLAIGAFLSAMRLPRAEVIAGVTAALAVIAIALLITSTRPLVRAGTGVAADGGPWFAGAGYLAFAAAAVLGAVASKRGPRRSLTF